MKANVKRNGHLLFSQGVSNNWSNIDSEMIINFADKNTYLDFKFFRKDNLLRLYCTNGNIDIIFASKPPDKISEQMYNKDQLILNIE